MTFSPAMLGGIADLAADFAPPDPHPLPDDDLIAGQRAVAEVRRRVDAVAAVLAGEIARRSRPELGHEGLAQRRGMRTPELLVQHVTGSTKQSARTLVRVGALLGGPDPSSVDPSSPDAFGAPWLTPVASAAARGEIGLDAVDAIRVGLGEPSDAVPVADLAAAAERLLDAARSLTVERLANRAREERALLDDSAVLERERLLRGRRYLHLTPLADGMTRISGLLDPESAAIVSAAYDGATSPRRGGPRFVDADARAAADALLDDDRTVEQIGCDALVELMRLGGQCGPEVLVGAEPPAVRVHVQASDLDSDVGWARIEGQSAPISLRSARRHLCAAGSVPIAFDSRGQPVDVGRERRLFTRRQRIALAARDGGCRFPDCDRAPSWTEAHHLTPWSSGGRTDLTNGLLLCRHHHLLVHDAGWRIEQAGEDYWFTPPPDAGLDGGRIRSRPRRHLPPPQRAGIPAAAGAPRTSAGCRPAPPAIDPVVELVEPAATDTC